VQTNDNEVDENSIIFLDETIFNERFFCRIMQIVNNNFPALVISIYRLRTDNLIEQHG